MRLASGAVARDGLMQFLVAAVVLAWLGGGAGHSDRTYRKPCACACHPGAFHLRLADQSARLRLFSSYRRGLRLFPRKACGSAQPHRRSEEHTSELQSLMRISYAVFCLKKKKPEHDTEPIQHPHHNIS